MSEQLGKLIPDAEFGNLPTCVQAFLYAGGWGVSIEAPHEQAPKGFFSGIIRVDEEKKPYWRSSNSPVEPNLADVMNTYLNEGDSSFVIIKCFIEGPLASR